MQVLLRHADVLAIFFDIAETYIGRGSRHKGTDDHVMAVFDDMQVVALEKIQNMDCNAECDHVALIGLLACANPELQVAVLQRCVRARAQIPNEELNNVTVMTKGRGRFWFRRCY